MKFRSVVNTTPSARHTGRGIHQAGHLYCCERYATSIFLSLSESRLTASRTYSHSFPLHQRHRICICGINRYGTAAGIDVVKGSDVRWLVLDAPTKLICFVYKTTAFTGPPARHKHESDRSIGEKHRSEVEFLSALRSEEAPPGGRNYCGRLLFGCPIRYFDGS